MIGSLLQSLTLFAHQFHVRFPVCDFRLGRRKKDERGFFLHKTTHSPGLVEAAQDPIRGLFLRAEICSILILNNELCFRWD